MNENNPSPMPEFEGSIPSYEVGDDFNDLAAVGVIIIDPKRERILLVRRLYEEIEDKALKNKVDQSDNIILALPSGSGPLSDNPTQPDQAVMIEIERETGSVPLSLATFHTYKRTDIPNAPKVGFYIAQMNPDSLNPTSQHKDWPGWFPIEWFGTKLHLPYAEHDRVVMDYIKERI